MMSAETFISLHAATWITSRTTFECPFSASGNWCGDCSIVTIVLWAQSDAGLLYLWSVLIAITAQFRFTRVLVRLNRSAGCVWSKGVQYCSFFLVQMVHAIATVGGGQDSMLSGSASPPGVHSHSKQAVNGSLAKGRTGKCIFNIFSEGKEGMTFKSLSRAHC